MFKIIKITLIIILLLFTGFYFVYFKNINTPFKQNDVAQIFIVSEGEGVKQITANLQKAELIKSDLFFNLYTWREKLNSSFQSGVYELSPHLSIVEIAHKLASGQVADREREIKIIEGWTIVDIDNYLSKNGILPQGEFKQKAEARLSEWNFAFSKPEFLSLISEHADLEGFLFPDTYRIFNNATAEDIIKKMLDNFAGKITGKMQEEIAKSGKIFFEIITMASIIEKEVNKSDDMKIVSGLLWKRISIGQALQVDSSINYITGADRPSPTYADLETDSAYNTYKHKDLPPGPIANPGLLAIEAALYPQDSQYFFYLNRQDTGETIFSRTYDEHLANKQKYLK
jgi:UPF0755 protein